MRDQLQQKIDLKTKPLGSLGQLETLAFKIGSVQKTLSPHLANPHILIFAADHGIAQEGVSAYPPEVTYQMLLNFLNEKAAINVFCKQNAIELKIVDAGVNADVAEHPLLIQHKVGYGTKNFLSEKAMTEEQLKECFRFSKLLIDNIQASSSNIIGFGEMGIGNTSSASLIISALTDIPLEACVGRGTGLDENGVRQKLSILQKAREHHAIDQHPLSVLQTFGGFEIAQMTGAMLAAHDHNMLLMIDGFIASAAFLVAYRLRPEIKDHAIFCHKSQEIGHQLLLDHLKETAILDLQLRLGEGTGCALAYPLILASVNFLNEMASFESAGIPTAQ